MYSSGIPFKLRKLFEANIEMPHFLYHTGRTQRCAGVHVFTSVVGGQSTFGPKASTLSGSTPALSPTGSGNALSASTSQVSRLVSTTPAVYVMMRGYRPFHSRTMSCMLGRCTWVDKEFPCPPLRPHVSGATPSSVDTSTRRPRTSDLHNPDIVRP